MPELGLPFIVVLPFLHWKTAPKLEAQCQAFPTSMLARDWDGAVIRLF